MASSSDSGRAPSVACCTGKRIVEVPTALPAKAWPVKLRPVKARCARGWSAMRFTEFSGNAARSALGAMGREAFCCARARPLSPAHASAASATRALTLRRVRLASRALGAERFDWKKISTLTISLERPGPRWGTKVAPCETTIMGCASKVHWYMLWLLAARCSLRGTDLEPSLFPSLNFLHRVWRLLGLRDLGPLEDCSIASRHGCEPQERGRVPQGDFGQPEEQELKTNSDAEALRGSANLHQICIGSWAGAMWAAGSDLRGLRRAPVVDVAR